MTVSGPLDWVESVLGVDVLVHPPSVTTTASSVAIARTVLVGGFGPYA